MELPFFSEIAPSRNVLLAGAGGGFDVFAALPLFFWLKRMGKTVHLANLTFSNLPECKGERVCREILKVTSASTGPSYYFPELALCEWLARMEHPTPVYAIQRGGVRPVARAYEWLAENLDLDTVVLIDGGTDMLMRGDEVGLGTPEEDISSLLGAESVLGVERKFVVCVGFGIDTHHGVSHGLMLENTADLIADGGFLGSWSLTKGMEEARLYGDAVDYAGKRYPQMPSIVNKSVLAATQGWFGDRHFTQRTAGSKLFLNPLMSFFWAFRLEAIASRLLYRDQVSDTEELFQLSARIERFRDGLPHLRDWVTIPH